MNEIWIKSALIRAIKTLAQTAVATIGSAAVLSAVDWRVVVSASILAGILSILTSVAGLPEVELAQAQIEGDDDDEFDESEIDDDDETEADE